MPRYTQPKKTWRYSPEFKVLAVQMSLEDGIQVQQVAHALDIHPFMLSRWRKEYREGKIMADSRKPRPTDNGKPLPTTEELAELEKLRRENARLQQENDLLKKWQRYLADRHQSDLDS
jgi:transposase